MAVLWNASDMKLNRRQIFQMMSASLLLATVPETKLLAAATSRIRKPSRLRAGDTIGLINPAGATYHPDDVAIAEETLAALGLKMKPGKHLLDHMATLPVPINTVPMISMPCLPMMMLPGY